MRHDLALFAQLLVYLVGTQLFGFLTRELLAHPQVLRGRPMRWLVGSLTVWYGGCLLDEVLSVLLAPGSLPRLASTLLDLVRGYAWLASFPLLAHAVWRTFAGAAPFGREARERRPSGWWLVPGYLTLALFVPAAVRALQQQQVALLEVARGVLPLVAVHVLLGSVTAAAMLMRSFATTEDGRLRQLLRALLVALGVCVVLFTTGGLFLRPDLLGSGEGSGFKTTGLLLTVASWLVPGLTFLYFVQRYNVLRLSVPFRSLRHFLGILALVVLAIAVGPAAGLEDSGLLRRFVAWGVVLALVVGMVLTPLARRVLERSGWLRRLLGRNVSPEQIERITRRFGELGLDEAELREMAAKEIGDWLATRAVFLPPKESADPETARLWLAFEELGISAFNRGAAPATRFESVLERLDLQAVVPLRVSGRVEGILGLGVSELGGSYQDGELEAVGLVLHQLGAALEVRRLLEERVALERRLAERERLSQLGMVAASLAHEVKNPLSAIKALAQTVREELAASNPRGEQVEDLRLILEQIDRLEEVTREILGFARPQEEGGVELTRLVRSALYVLGHEASRRGVVIDAAGVAEVGRADGTGGSWQTVVVNLVWNAVRHAPAGSAVRVWLVREGWEVRFATENGGLAIAPEIAGRLFEPFVSTDGTGLGLALVALRVRELGGDVGVDNQPGRIVFQVRVPLRWQRSAARGVEEGN